MSFDPEKMAPRKLNVEQLQKGLSVSQMSKIEYVCMLLKVTPQQLVNMAPHLFNEGVTESNTVTETPVMEVVKEEEPMKPYPSYGYDEYINDDDYSYA